MYQRLTEVQYLPSSHPCWGDAERVRRIRGCDAPGFKEPVQWHFPEWHHVREVRAQPSCRPFRWHAKENIADWAWSLLEEHHKSTSTGLTSSRYVEAWCYWKQKQPVQSPRNTAPSPGEPGWTLLPWCLLDGSKCPRGSSSSEHLGLLHIQSNVWVAHISLLAYKTQVVGRPSECLQLSEKKGFGVREAPGRGPQPRRRFGGGRESMPTSVLGLPMTINEGQIKYHMASNRWL